MTARQRIMLAAAVAVAIATGAARAMEAPTGTFVYTIHHEDRGDIGTLRIVSTRDGDRRVYDQSLRIAVKIAFVTAYRQESQRKEVWRGARLVAYESTTDDDGKKSRIVGRAEGDKFIIDGPAGHIVAPATVYPSNPFDPGIVNAALLMDTASGKLLHVTVTPGEVEEIAAAGGQVAARRYAVTGDLQRDLWFDPSGKLLQFAFKNDGALVTFTLR